MKERPLRTTVIGSYPFPGWLEFACQHLDQFGDADRAKELFESAYDEHARRLALLYRDLGNPT